MHVRPRRLCAATHFLTHKYLHLSKLNIRNPVLDSPYCLSAIHVIYGSPLFLLRSELPIHTVGGGRVRCIQAFNLGVVYLSRFLCVTLFCLMNDKWEVKWVKIAPKRKLLPWNAVDLALCWSLSGNNQSLLLRLSHKVQVEGHSCLIFCTVLS